MANQTPAEQWVSVPNYPGYLISNQGNVKSLDRFVNRKDGTLHKRIGKHTKLSANTNGYLQFSPTNPDGVRTPQRIHRLIAILFVHNPSPDTFTEVNHINGIKTDNRAENLEWVTPRQNKLHALQIGLIKRGADLSYSRLVLDTQTGVFYDTIGDAAIAKSINYRTLQHWLVGDRTNKSSLIFA